MPLVLLGHSMGSFAAQAYLPEHSALIDGVDGRGLVFLMSLPPREFEVMSSSATDEYVHRFRREDDDIPRVHREVHG